MLQTANLGMFTGTEHYYRWSILFPRMLLSDGAKFVAENGGESGAYWLMDAIASHQPKMLRHSHDCNEFQLWTLTVTEKKLPRKGGITRSAVLCGYRDSGEPPVVTQKIGYTDFDMPEIKLYVERCDESKWLILLPSEH